MDGGFEVIVSGRRKGVGSSRETAVQAEKWSGIRIAIAESFAPIHARNNVNQGVLMGDHAMLARLQTGEQIPLVGVHGEVGPDHAARDRARRAVPVLRRARARRGEAAVARRPAKRPMTMAEKILAAHLLPGPGRAVT